MRTKEPNRHLAVLPGDLPYLRPIQLQAALVQASEFPNACVADRHGIGTTLLTARRGADLNPLFGMDYLRTHRIDGAVELSIPVQVLRKLMPIPLPLASFYFTIN